MLIQKRQAVQSVPPFDFVVHTASPYHFNVQDPVKDFLDPAIKGTTGILRSVKEYAPSVRRVVITSSSAAMINPANHPKVYDESSWAAVTWEEAMEPQNSYRASKASVGSFPLHSHITDACRIAAVLRESGMGVRREGEAKL